MLCTQAPGAGDDLIKCPLPWYTPAASRPGPQ